MKASVAQINTTPGDFTGNVDKIIRACIKAIEEESRLVVFPELTVCGYGVKDLLYQDFFIPKNLEAVNKVCEYSKDKDVYIVIGYVDKNFKGHGKKFRNMAAVIYNGSVVVRYQKQLLPFYDVFDEGRYFEPGNEPVVVNIDGHRCGITICEDLWNDKGQDDYNYINNPIKEYRELHCDTIINLSSSPYYKDKQHARRLLVKEIADNNPIKNIIYCNQYGGQDELVFDGHSMIISNGTISDVICPPLLPKPIHFVDVLTIDIDGHSFIPNQLMASSTSTKTHLSMILLGLHDYAKKLNIDQFVIGSSGGIDSAVVIALAAMAFGPEKVHAIKMPSKWSSDHSVNDAITLHKNFGVNDYQVTIDHDTLLTHVNSSLGMKSDNYNFVADENIQARMRGQIVMHFSNATGALPLTTGNKTELALGYCTLYGDMNGGYNPIGDLYKMEVYEIAQLINEIYGKEMIPNNIISKAPSAELAPGQTDEASLLPYPILDCIVKFYVEKYIDGMIDFKKHYNKSENYNENVVSWINDENNEAKFLKMLNRIDMMEFKRRQASPCTKVTFKAFGTGRRLPIVKVWER